MKVTNHHPLLESLLGQDFLLKIQSEKREESHSLIVRKVKGIGNRFFVFPFPLSYRLVVREGGSTKLDKNLLL